jgi:hypothetical protein
MTMSLTLARPQQGTGGREKGSHPTRHPGVIIPNPIAARLLSMGRLPEDL